MSLVVGKHAKAVNNVAGKMTQIESITSQASAGVEETAQSLQRLAEYVTVLQKSVEDSETAVGHHANSPSPEPKPFDLQQSLSAKEV